MEEIKLIKNYLGQHPESELKTVLEARIQELEAKSVNNSAVFTKEIEVRDPDSRHNVQMSVFKHEDSGAMFAIDSSYLEQCFDDDTDPVIPDPFNPEQNVMLLNL